MRAMANENPNLVVYDIYLADDGAVSGTKQAVRCFLEHMQRECAGVGLEFKCVTLNPESHLRVPLGDAVGGLPAVDNMVAALDRLGFVQDPQVAFALLRQCLSSSARLTYYASCIEPGVVDYAAADEAMLRALERIVGQHLGEAARLQASLAVRDGGLGLRLMSVHGAAVYQDAKRRRSEWLREQVGKTADACGKSYSAAVVAGGVGQAPRDAKEKAGSAARDLDERRKKEWMRVCAGLGVDSLKQAKDVACPESGDWHSVVPCGALGTRMDPEAFRRCMAAHLGEVAVPEAVGGQAVCPRCSAEVAPDGRHLLGCAAERSTRHNSVRDALLNVLHASGAAVAVEQTVEAAVRKVGALQPLPPPKPAVSRPAVVSSSVAADARPIDLLAWHGALGPRAPSSAVALDVAIVSPFAGHASHGTDPDPDLALATAHDRKMRAAPELARAGIAFVPFILSVNGRMHDGAKQILALVAARWARHLAVPEAEARRMLRQRVSLAVHRGNGVQLQAAVVQAEAEFGG